MKHYIENPKTKGSGIICAIPQIGTCPIKCEDCFFQNQRSYLEPLSDNLPNLPDDKNAFDRILRVNDGNDSNNDKETVTKLTNKYSHKFYNTSIPKLDFDAPVVLTLNPGDMTNTGFHQIKNIPKNLMFVRFRTNTWNLVNAKLAIEYYTSKEVPVILTFMAYHSLESIPKHEQKSYMLRKRTTNEYYAITTEAWRNIMKHSLIEDNIYVYSCGKIEGEKGKTSCRFCGNCIREFYATKERMRV